MIDETGNLIEDIESRTYTDVLWMIVIKIKKLEIPGSIVMKNQNRAINFTSE